MAEPRTFEGVHLIGAFIIVRLEFVAEPMVDAIGRPALAKTHIVGRNIELAILSGLTPKETSVTLYHEILEAVTVASSSVLPTYKRSMKVTSSWRRIARTISSGRLHPTI